MSIYLKIIRGSKEGKQGGKKRPTGGKNVKFDGNQYFPNSRCREIQTGLKKAAPDGATQPFGPRGLRVRNHRLSGPNAICFRGRI